MKVGSWFEEFEDFLLPSLPSLMDFVPFLMDSKSCDGIPSSFLEMEVREERIPQKFSLISSFFIESADWISILEKKFENSWKEVEKSSPPLPSSVDQLDGILGFPSSSPRLTLEFHLSLEDSKLSSQTGWRNSNFQSGFPNFAIRNSKISSKEI